MNTVLITNPKHSPIQAALKKANSVPAKSGTTGLKTSYPVLNLLQIQEAKCNSLPAVGYENVLQNCLTGSLTFHILIMWN